MRNMINLFKISLKNETKNMISLIKKYRTATFMVLFFFNIKINPINDIINTNSIKVSVSHGFIGFKTIDLFRKLAQTSDNITKTGLKNNILICLAKLNLKFETCSNNFSKVISIKPINYNYNHYYMTPGCISEYPGPSCIMRRVGICSIGYGFEYYMKGTNNILSQNIMFYINIIGKKILPFDLIVSYSPLIISLKCGLYFDFNIINFSLGSFIKSLIMSFAKIENHLKDNWDINSNDDAEYTNHKIKYIEKIIDIQKDTKSKLKYVFIDNILMNIVNNIQLFIGIKFSYKY